MQADLLRENFLSFFKSKKHKVVDSDSLVPKDDPTVLFTPAGMNQFKKQFLGQLTGPRRAATAQRCLRTDDLEKVGKTAVHHTFFEMLGNFSFGDYFKDEAISWAWEFLTAELKIPPQKLWVSVYKDDDEAYKIWKGKIKIPAAKIIKLGDKENFWPAEAKKKGPNGPCGPCSEIFYDFGKNPDCKNPDCSPACKCGRFTELWNLVFTQFNRRENGVLEPLPKKNIDTGMGLERLAAVMQGVKSNFETDLFKPLVKEISSSIEYRVLSIERSLIYAIADHIRAVTFSIYDGILPSNEGRGYVVRKIIRKATFHLRNYGVKKPLLYKLVPIVAEIMKVPYPDLEKRRENISGIILAEENSFINTLNSSANLSKEKYAGFNEKQDPEEAGRIAFQLYDTYGIPFELTKDWLDKNNIKVSGAAFEHELNMQKTRSKSQSAMKGDVFAKGLDLGVRATKFLGYRDDTARAEVLKVIKGDEVKLVLDKTVFYAESGGQVGDTGVIIKGKNIFGVSNTQKIDKVVIHAGKIKQGSFKKGDLVTLKVDAKRRLSIARNHTATHLLQAALRKVLGSHIQQQGSLVAEERLRFDFTHFKDIKDDELSRIEEEVNSYIQSNYKVEKKQMTLKEAKKIGALAFFAEKYEDKVRVISIGNISKELCAGTHLDNVGTIGLFKIIKEGSVSSGIRRIEARTAEYAYKSIKEKEAAIQEELEKKLQQIKELESKLNSQKSSILKASIEENKGEVINGINVSTHIDLDLNSVRRAVDLIKEKAATNTVIISSTGTNLANQIFLAIGLTSDLCQKGLDASKIIKEVAGELGGSGGGRKDFAQAGGNKPQNFEKVLQRIKDILRG